MTCPRCKSRSLVPAREIILGQALQVVSCRSCGARFERPEPEALREERLEEEMKKECSEEGCTGEVLAKGLCKTHYWRKKSEERKEKKSAEKGQGEKKPRAAAKPEKVKERAAEETSETEEETRVDKGVKKAVNRNHSHEMTIRFFERDMELLQDLTETAERERRYVSAEILVRLERLKRLEGGGDA